MYSKRWCKLRILEVPFVRVHSTFMVTPLLQGLCFLGSLHSPEPVFIVGRVCRDSMFAAACSYYRFFFFFRRWNWRTDLLRSVFPLVPEAQKHCFFFVKSMMVRDRDNGKKIIFIQLSKGKYILMWKYRIWWLEHLFFYIKMKKKTGL